MFDLELRFVKERLLLSAAKLVSPWLSPNQLTCLGFGFGLLCCWYLAQARSWLAQLFWVLNRLCDGLDGIVARVSGRQTDFGGYLDIGIDFTIYALIPVALAWSQQSLQLMTLVALMEGTYFVNAALLFQAAAISEKRALHAKSTTSVAMPRGLVEGMETMVMYSAFIAFPGYAVLLVSAFALAVSVTILHRLLWAFSAMEELPAAAEVASNSAPGTATAALNTPTRDTPTRAPRRRSVSRL